MMIYTLYIWPGIVWIPLAPIDRLSVPIVLVVIRVTIDHMDHARHLDESLLREQELQ